MTCNFSKIALIVTFFGKIPFWFPAFQISCQYNKEIDWIIFSDAEKPKSCPENIIFHSLSINDFCSLASSKLDIDVLLEESFLYKVCDFKPAFGIIYEDYIKEYDFWGHCDIDVVWGEIRRFITEEMLFKHNIITSRVGRVSGHFCIYRNVYKINRLFIKMPNVKKNLKKISSCERLDEIFFTNYLHFLTEKTFYAIMKKIITGKNFTPNIYWNRSMTTSGKDQREIIENKDKYFIWNNGRTFMSNGNEVMYIHFHVLKKEPTFKTCNVSFERKEMKVTNEGII